MVRIAVTGYLVVAAAMGPGLCSCTTVRLLADCSHVRRSASEAQNGESETHQHCACDQNSSGHIPKRPSSTPEREPSCPCQDHQAIPVAFLATDITVSALYSSLAIELSFESAFLVTASAVALLATEERLRDDRLRSATRTAREILRAFQILRC